MASRGAAALGEALEAATGQVAAAPSSGREAIDYAGGVAELKRQLSGLGGPPRRSTYRSDAGFEAARTRWRNVSRRVERYAQGTRGGRLDNRERGLLQAAAVRRRWAGMVRNGVRLSVTGQVSPYPGSPDRRVRDIPSGGPGIWISPDDLMPVLELLDDGEQQAAGALLWATMVDDAPGHYGVPGMDLHRLDDFDLMPE